MYTNTCMCRQSTAQATPLESHTDRCLHLITCGGLPQPGDTCVFSCTHRARSHVLRPLLRYAYTRGQHMHAESTVQAPIFTTPLPHCLWPSVQGHICAACGCLLRRVQAAVKNGDGEGGCVYSFHAAGLSLRCNRPAEQGPAEQGNRTRAHSAKGHTHPYSHTQHTLCTYTLSDAPCGLARSQSKQQDPRSKGVQKI